MVLYLPRSRRRDINIGLIDTDFFRLLLADNPRARTATISHEVKYLGRNPRHAGANYQGVITYYLRAAVFVDEVVTDVTGTRMFSTGVPLLVGIEDILCVHFSITLVELDSLF